MRGFNPLDVVEWIKINVIPISTMVGFGGAAYSFVFGDAYTNLVISALGFIIGDVVTGFLKATSWRTLSSQVAYSGLRKKAAMILSMAFGNWLDNYFFQGRAHVCKGFFCNYVISIEIISILENLTSTGLAIPKEINEMLRGFLLTRQGEGIRQINEVVKEETAPAPSPAPATHLTTETTQTLSMTVKETES